MKERDFGWDRVVDKLLNRMEEEEIKWVLWDYERELNSWREDRKELLKKIDELGS